MIGICIKYFHENYGGMLQAFATVKWLERNEISYELIRYQKDKSLIRIVKSVPRLLNTILLNDKYEAVQRGINRQKHKAYRKDDDIRHKAFQKFKESNFMRLSPIFRGMKELKNGARRYDAVVSGSDQLWSPAGLPTNFYNLQFVPDDIRKISVASSFGVSNIPWYQKKRTKAFLERIEFVSMRENRGSQIVKELTGRQVPVILDPVFFFDAAEWNDMIPFRKDMKEPYIFAYFLGATIEYREAVKAVAEQTGYKVVALRHMDQYVKEDENFGDIAPYDVDPQRFLDLIRGADYVCTDSFHGTAFSVIFHKKFITFNRYNDNAGHSKNSRIESLCNNLGLDNRRYDKNKDFSLQLKADMNYELVDEKLLNMKEKTYEFLKEAFRGIHHEGML